MRHTLPRVATDPLLCCLLAALLCACGGSPPRPDPASPDGGTADVDSSAGDRAPMPQSPTLGLSCGGACTKPFCVTGDPGTCGGTTLTQPCVGRQSGMYCTRTCTTDADCATASRGMSCLNSCSEFPELAGFCWSQSDVEFLRGSLCSGAAPDGGPPPPNDAAVTTTDGASPPQTDGGPDSGAGDDTAMKFCNQLLRNGANTDLTLEIAGRIRLQAITGSCSPALDQACPAIPAGEVPIRILEGTSVLVEDVVGLEAGYEYFIIAELDGDMVFFQTETFETGARCSTTNPLTLPRRPGKALRSRSARFR